MRFRKMIRLLGLLCASAFATGQIPDLVIYNDTTYSLNTNPLVQYFAANPQARPKERTSSTACWRGYQAIFQIKENKLFVKSYLVETLVKQKKRKGYETIEKDLSNKVFPKMESRFCDWYTGMLIMPHGRQLQYVHMGYGSTYENYIGILVEKGLVRSVTRYSSEEFANFRQSQFALYKTTDHYKNALKEIMSDTSDRENKLTHEMADDFLYQFEAERYLSQEFPSNADLITIPKSDGIPGK